MPLVAYADAAERPQNVGVHVTDERAEAGSLVDVLHHDDARRAAR